MLEVKKAVAFHLAFVALAMSLSTLLPAQQLPWEPVGGAASELRRPGEVTIEKAVEAVADLVKKLGLPATDSRAKVSRATTDPAELQWQVRLGGNYIAWVSTKTGRVRSFDCIAFAQPERLAARTGVPFFPNDMVLVQTGRKLLERLGLPKDMHCSKVQVFLDNDPKLGNGNEPGSAMLIFAAMPHGYGHVNDANSVILFLDPQDGSVTGYRNTLDYFSIQSWTVNLTLEQAKSIADGVAKEYKLKEPLRGEKEFVPARKCELLYVIPDGSYGAPKAKLSVPIECRLAWVIRYPYRHTVYVDAGDGRILGGGGRNPKMQKKDKGKQGEPKRS